MKALTRMTGTGRWPDPHPAPKGLLTVLSSQTLADGGCPDSPRFLTFDVTIMPARYTTLIVKHAGLVPIR